MQWIQQRVTDVWVWNMFICYPGFLVTTFLDRKLCWMYFDYSNLHLFTGHIFSTVNLNTNGNKKCGEAIKGPLERHQGTVQGTFASAQCSQPCLRNSCKAKGSDPVTLPSGSGFGLQCWCGINVLLWGWGINVLLWDGWEYLMIGNNTGIVGEKM